MPTKDDLRLLLHIPSESLSVEYKSWLDLGETRNKAILAKAAIALANEGGGIIVLGMRRTLVKEACSDHYLGRKRLQDTAKTW